MSDGQPDDIRVEVEQREDGRVATITVDYRARLNILDSGRIARLRQAFIDLADDDELRVAVLTGAGDRAFIGGADVNELVALDEHSAEGFIRSLHEACQAMRDLPVPVIAKIHGYCLGGGLEIAAACDLRAASEDASFGMPEVAVGIPSVIEAALLPTIVGHGRARELVYTAQRWDARVAYEAGLLERVVPASALDAAVDDWVEAIMANGPLAIRAQKRLVQQWERLAPEEAIEASIAAFVEAHRSAEPRTFQRRFLDRPRG
jgi:enoyl-CoA hydratase